MLAAKNSSAANRALAPARSRTAGTDRVRIQGLGGRQQGSLGRGAVHGDLGNDNYLYHLETITCHRKGSCDQDSTL